MPFGLDGSKGGTFPTWTTAGRPASPVAGQTGYNSTLGTLETYNGSLWEPFVARTDSGTVTPTMLSQPLTLATAQNTTSGTAIDFTGIPSWVKRITVLFQGVSTNGTSLVQVQLGSGSIATSTYVGNYGNPVAASVHGTGFVTGGNASAADLRSGTVVLCHMGANIWTEAGIIGVTSGQQPYVSSGYIALSGVLDRLRLTTVNGTDTFDAGSVNILYEG